MVKTNENILDELSDLVWSEDKPFNSERALELVAKRNEILCRNFEPTCPHQTTKKQYENYCEFLTSRTEIPNSFVAYHSGPVGQSTLVDDTNTTFEDFSITHHIFFSLNLAEIVGNYVLPERKRNRGIYVTDVKSLKNTRIQIDYSGEALWCDKICQMIEFYNNPNWINIILKSGSDDIKYLEPFREKPKQKLRQAIIHEIQSWLTNYTVPFNLLNLEEYRKRDQTYLLVPQPVGVND